MTRVYSERSYLLRLAPIVWGALALGHWGQIWISANAMGRPWLPWLALIGTAPWWLLWGLFTPFVAWLTERYPLSGDTRRSVAFHIALAVVVSAAQLFLVATIYWFTIGRVRGPATSWTNQLMRYTGNFGMEALVTYAGIAGIFLALDAARRSRESELQQAHLLARNAALEGSLTAARLAALRMQLNPHFLFNTLSAVAGLIGEGRTREAREVIGRLGALLRETLARGQDQLVPVHEEMELVEDYLAIERLRFSDRLAVSCTVADDVRDARIPSLLLQPLVENAVRHGVEPTRRAGRVDVTLDSSGEDLRIRVADSGNGFVTGGRASTRDGNGVGLSNTRDRLRHLYGDDASLETSNVPGGGALVTVMLPRQLA